jgi:hypothetical protein
MNFELFLVRQQCVHRPVQPVVIDPIHGHSQQFGQSCLRIPLLGRMQFARGFQQPADDQNQRTQRPRHVFATLRHHTREEGV